MRFQRKRKGIDLTPPLSVFSSAFVSLVASTMTQIFLDDKPYSPRPPFLLSCPFLFFPIHAYSPTCTLFPLPLSPSNIEFPLYLGHAYLLVRLFLAFSVLPWRIHIRSMILFSASHLFHYPVCVCLLFVLRRYYCSSRFFDLSFLFPFSVFVFVCLLYATSPPPQFPLDHSLFPASPCFRSPSGCVLV